MTSLVAIIHRRTWFLERVLKLGLVQIAKEYECVRRLPCLVLFCFSLVYERNIPFRNVNANE